MRRHHLVAVAIVALATFAASCGSGSAPAASGATTADLALYDGADRTERLVEGAKREGEITIYTSAQTTDLGPVVEAYEKKYGIKASIWRAGSEAVLNRALQEARAGRHTVDVVETNGPELESLSREQILQIVKSPHHKDLIAPAIRPHGEWVGTRLNVFVQAYNTKLVKKEELPKTWDDLTDPKWKGRLGIEQEDSDWLAGIYGEIGEERAGKVFKQITTTNGVSVRKGHTLLTQLVASGEVPLALTVYNYKAEQLRREGAPIDWFTIGNAIARPNGVGVARQAPHPHAALLFYDFELSEEGQTIIAQREFVPTSSKVDTPLNKVPMTFVDARVSIDEYDKWKNLYTDLFGAASWLIVAILCAGCGGTSNTPDAPASQHEGALTLYTTIAEKDLPTLIQPFESKYGIKVTVWRAGTDRVLQRTTAEAAAGRHDVDVIHFGSPEMEALAREQILLPIDVPGHADLQPGSVPAHKQWAATLLSVWVQAYNTKLLTRDELPRSYSDLLDARWKGKLGIEAKDQDWFASVVDVMGSGDKGLGFFRDLASRNGVSVRLGHTLLNNMVISGEVPVALTVYNYMPEQAKKKGAPIDWFALEPAIARSNAVGVARRAPHPNAALLFYNYLLSEEAQRSFVSMDYVPSNTKVVSPLAGVRILQVDPVRVLDEAEKWTGLFEQILVRRTAALAN